MQRKLTITGKIVSGVRQGAYFTQIDWFREQCVQKLGYTPFPGTLNIEIPDQYIPQIEALEKEKGVEFIPPDTTFCSGRAFPVSVEGLSAAIIMPAQEVRVHAKNVIEVIAPLQLKTSLKKTDGDPVTLTINR